jgi:hypothetical protein
MRFQDAARDARAVVYAGVQADPLVARAASALARATTGGRLLARAVMNGETVDPDGWRTAFPALFGAAVDAATRELAEEILGVSLAVAGRGDQVRSQLRGAIVEELTERLLGERLPSGAIRRERRVLFDGVPAEIHPYDVTVELDGRPEAYDCKWGARGINADVILQLGQARSHAEAEGARLTVALVVFDARRSCLARLARQTGVPKGLGLVALESLDRLAGRSSAASSGPPSGGS